jgi:hypothetical protein
MSREVSTVRFEVPAAALLKSVVAEVMAAVMRLIWAPTTGTAAALSSADEDGERVARVASDEVLLALQA